MLEYVDIAVNRDLSHQPRGRLPPRPSCSAVSRESFLENRRSAWLIAQFEFGGPAAAKAAAKTVLVAVLAPAVDAVARPVRAIHSTMARLTNCGPLSERMGSGAPSRLTRTARR